MLTNNGRRAASGDLSLDWFIVRASVRAADVRPSKQIVAAKSVALTIEQLPDARGERGLRERLLNHLNT
jgi:hypothetical protein